MWRQKEPAATTVVVALVVCLVFASGAGAVPSPAPSDDFPVKYGLYESTNSVLFGANLTLRSLGMVNIDGISVTPPGKDDGSLRTSPFFDMHAELSADDGTTLVVDSFFPDVVPAMIGSQLVKPDSRRFSKGERSEQNS